MKKATIKRRKRIIPAQGEDEDATDTGDCLSFEKTPERGSMNDDGSVNLGFRRQESQPMALEPRSMMRQDRQGSPLLASSDLAVYHQQSLRPLPTKHPSSGDDNRLPPISAMGAAMSNSRQPSLSPSSYMSPGRKRSFSSHVDTEMRDAPPAEDSNPKRLSSIRSLLQAHSDTEGHPDYSLPPLRSPGTTTHSAPSPVMYSRDQTPAVSEAGEKSKAERRAALEREAAMMREILAEKEKELMALGND